MIDFYIKNVSRKLKLNLYKNIMRYTTNEYEDMEMHSVSVKQRSNCVLKRPYCFSFNFFIFDRFFP